MDLTTFIKEASKTRPKTAAATERLLSRVPALKELDIDITPDLSPAGWNTLISFGAKGPYQMWLMPGLENKDTSQREEDFRLWYMASAFAMAFIQATGRKGTDNQTAALVAKWGITQPPYVNTPAAPQAVAATKQNRSRTRRSAATIRR